MAYAALLKGHDAARIPFGVVGRDHGTGDLDNKFPEPGVVETVEAVDNAGGIIDKGYFLLQKTATIDVVPVCGRIAISTSFSHISPSVNGCTPLKSNTKWKAFFNFFPGAGKKAASCPKGAVFTASAAVAAKPSDAL